jgi:hypothetical protein
MNTRKYLVTLVVLGVMASAGSAYGADVEVLVVSQLACPLKVDRIVAKYGTAGAKYKPADYANINPDGEEKFWLYGAFENAGDGAITSFTFEIRGYDAVGKRVFHEEDVLFDYPLREGDPESKEWSWPEEEAAGIAKVVFIPWVINYPAGRTWESDEKFVAMKFEELGITD